MGAAPSPDVKRAGAGRAARTPRPRGPRFGLLGGRVAAGHLVMVVAGLLGGLLTLAVLRRADDTTPVAVAARDLLPGERIAPGAIEMAEVRADAGVIERLVAGTSLGALDGMVVVRPVGAGAPLRAGDLERQVADAVRTMSFAVERDRAVDGQVTAGDDIDVIAVDERSGEAAWVLRGGEVLAATGGSRGPLGSDDRVTVTVAVGAEEAKALAVALERGPVTLVRSTGAPPLDPPATAAEVVG